ncbi:MAG: exo-alpha-sialidase, partial [Thermoplasmata archaeon]|nr:exo-alpha-sialidase [Thermoplasmata archaeon]
MKMTRRGISLALILMVFPTAISVFLPPVEGEDGPFGNVVFQSSVLVSPPANENTTQTMPSSASYGEHLYIAWQEYTVGTSDIYLRELNLSTREWSAPVMIDDSRRNSQIWDDGSSQKKVAIAAEGDTVAAVWLDDREGKYLVYASISQDAGKSFGKSYPVWIDTRGVQKDPDVAIKDDKIYVVWADTDEAPVTDEGRIYFCSGLISGTVITFGEVVAVSPAVSLMAAKEPAVWVDEEGGIYVVWSGQEKGSVEDWDIYLSLSFNDGETFSAPLNLIEEPGLSSQWSPDIVSSGNNILVVWQDFREGNWDIYGTASYDGGVHFTSDFRVSKDSSGRGQYTPSVALSPNGTVYVVFGDLRAGGDDYEIYMSYTTDWGRNFWGDYRVSDDTQSKSQINPTATAPSVGEAVLFVAYEDNRDDHYRIRLSRWIPGRGMVSLPYLTDVHVNPEAGKPGEYFYFKATYFNSENAPPAPGYPRVWLYYEVNGIRKVYPGCPFPMKRRLMPAQDFIYTNGEEYILPLKIKNAVPFYFQVEAMAEGGYRSVFSDMIKGPVVDDSPPECIKVSPKIDGWSFNRTVLCEAVFQDEGAGVDPRYVEVSYSYRGEENLLVWHHVADIEYTSNTTCVARFEMILSNGTLNVIQFRAMDRVGNGYSYSPLLRFNYDGEPPYFSMIQPTLGKVIHSTDVVVRVLITDPGGTGVAPESIQYRFSTKGIMGYSTWMTPMGEEIE